MIVAHLDLDAFFAAVEELENPELRRVPLVVGGDPHGRGVVATANYVARRLRHPLGDVVRRGAAPLPARRLRPAAALRSTASTRARSGRSSARSCRRSSRPGSTRATSTSARSRPPSTTRARSPRRCRRSCGRARASRARSASRRSKVVAKVASDRRKPGGLTVVRPGREARVPRAAPDPRCCRASARAPRSGSSPPGSRRSAGSPRSATTSCARCCAGKVGRELRDRARGIDPRRLEVSTERISISNEETFARDVGDPERLHDELRRMAERLAEHLRGRGQIARTVTTKLRYPDFAIRTRSTSLAVGHRRRRPDRRARLRAARPRAPRPAGAAAPRRRRRLRARRARATFPACGRLNCYRLFARYSPFGHARRTVLDYC